MSKKQAQVRGRPLQPHPRRNHPLRRERPKDKVRDNAKPGGLKAKGNGARKAT